MRVQGIKLQALSTELHTFIAMSPLRAALALASTVAAAKTIAAGLTILSATTARGYRALVTRSAFTPLQRYLDFNQVVVEGVSVLATSTALAAYSRWAAQRLLPVHALGISDASAVCAFPRWVRLCASPVNLSPEQVFRCVGHFTARDVLHLAVASTIRKFIVTFVTLAQQRLDGRHFIGWLGVGVRSLANAGQHFGMKLLGWGIAAAAARYLPTARWWLAAHGAAWLLTSSVLPSIIARRVNAALSGLIHKLHYRFAAPLVAGGASHYAFTPPPPFRIEELEAEFGALTAVELGDLSQFANDVVQSALTDHSVRLHAMRFLARVQLYVSAVNDGRLERRVHCDLGSLPTHAFTARNVADRAKSSTGPFRCASCRVRFVAGDVGTLLPCGHILHLRAQCPGDLASPMASPATAGVFGSGSAPGPLHTAAFPDVAPPQPQARAQGSRGSLGGGSFGGRPGLPADWCPTCVRPIKTLQGEARMASFTAMRGRADKQWQAWETDVLLPDRLLYGDWGEVAQLCRRAGIVEESVPLHLIPADHSPGQMPLLELPIAFALTFLSAYPTHEEGSLLKLSAVE